MPKLRRMIDTAIITAFTLATALIWRDVIIDAIETFVPPSKALEYKLITAVIATIILVIAIYVITKTESELDIIMRRLKSLNNKKKNNTKKKR